VALSRFPKDVVTQENLIIYREKKRRKDSPMLERGKEGQERENPPRKEKKKFTIKMSRSDKIEGSSNWRRVKKLNL